MKSIKLLTTACLLSTALTSVASAQTIDYGTLESIFGEPVTASATGKPQKASDAPVSMEIISSEEIRRSPELRAADKVLSTFAGVMRTATVSKKF